MSLSKYVCGLAPEARTRYVEKLKLLQCDCPYSLPKDLWTEGLKCCSIIPTIDYGDIFSYLVFSRSDVDVEKTKQAYKGLKAESKQAVKDGWVKCFMALRLSSGAVLVQAKVTPFQAIGNTPHSPWAAIRNDCGVICAHCTCAVGLGEVCNHVGSLLLVSVYSVEIHEGKGRTEDKCTWADLSSQPGTYKQVREMGKVRKHLFPIVQQPKKEDISELMMKLAEMPGKPAAALLLEDNCCSYLPPALKIKLPKPLSHMYKKSYTNLPLEDLVAKSREIYEQISITKEQCMAISSLTTNQSSSKSWFIHRSFRITASKFKQVVHTNIVVPSLSLVKQICYPEAFCFSNEATRWGIKHESIAMKAFEERIRQSGIYPGFKINKTGMFISLDQPFLSASPDGIFMSPTKGTGTIEIKCPYKWRLFTLRKSAEDPASPLDFDEETEQYYIKKKHEYYYQLQLQMYTTGYRFAFFVMYTTVDLVYLEVPYDGDFLNIAIPKAKEYFLSVIMPEVLAGYFYKNSFLHTTQTNSDNNPYLPCYCQKIEPVVVTVVTCANLNCKRKIFHVKCIYDNHPSLSKITQSWSCLSCKKATRSAQVKEKRLREKNKENQTTKGSRSVTVRHSRPSRGRKLRDVTNH